MTTTRDNAPRIFVLPSGARVRVRPIRPSDAAEIRRAFHALSPESRYLRFFSEMSDLSDDALAYLTQIDFETHIAFVALVESPDLKSEHIVGVARAIRLPNDPDIAEAAITVADDLHHMGLGRFLLTVLTEVAREKGIRAFRGEVLESNGSMRSALDKLGIEPQSRTDEMLVYQVPLASSDASEGSPVRTVLRAAAQSLTIAIRVLRHIPR